MSIDDFKNTAEYNQFQSSAKLFYNMLVSNNASNNDTYAILHKATDDCLLDSAYKSYMCENEEFALEKLKSAMLNYIIVNKQNEISEYESLGLITWYAKDVFDKFCKSAALR